MCAMYLKITDGTTTLDLLGNDATNSFNLEARSWGPAVATRREGTMGNQSPYNEVIEQMPLYVQSDTDAATVLDNLETLAGLIDQAASWDAGEAVDPVIIQYSPNSNSVYYEAVVLGPPEGEQGLVLPPNFTADLWQNAVDSVTFQFTRRGLWLGAAETASSSSLDGPAKLTGTFPAGDVDISVLDLEIDTPANGLDDAMDGFVVVCEPDHVVIVEAENATKSGCTTHADTSASNDNTVIGNTGVNSFYIEADVSAINADARLFTVFASVRNNSSTLEYTASILSTIPSSSPPPTTIVPISSGPTIIKFASVAVRRELSKVRLLMQLPGVTTITAGNEAEIDWIIVVAHSLYTNVIATRVAASGGDDYVTFVKSHELTDISPEVYIENAPGSYQGNYKTDGDVFMLSTGNQATVVIMATDPSLSTGWTINGSGGTVSNDVVFTRRPAYRVPQ